jgi:hypothetical protein
MQHRRPIRGLIVTLAMLACVSGATGQGCYVWEPFGDGLLAPTWFSGGTPGTIISVGETAGQLQFWGQANITNNDYRAYAWSSGWQVDMSHSWAIQADWYVQPAYPNPGSVVDFAEVGLAFGLLLEGDAASADIDRGLTISAVRGLAYYNQPYNLQAIDYFVNGSTPVNQVWSNRSWSAATMYVWYDATYGVIYFDQYPPGVGSTPMYATNVTGLSTELIATIGFGGYSYGVGAPAFANSNVAVDNVCMLYGTLAGARVGACVVSGGCFDTIAESCEGSFTVGVRCEDICTCQWDPDCSGAVGLGDISLMLGSWGDCTGCSTDLDESGVVDVHDLLLVLEHWDGC